MLVNKFLKQKNKKKNGFTLIETLVAISIFSVAVIGMLAILASGLTNTISAKKKMTATFLAQEGIEYMRNLRDTYVLYSTSYNDGWNKFNVRVYPECEQNGECFFNDETVNFLEPITPMIDLKLVNCGGSCPTINYSSSNARYNSAGLGDVETSFVRSIKTQKLSEGETKVTSTVSWDNGTKKVSLSESLFNWVE
jgi:prepilin-type N-terminal cleavage/methylation domain-containing protein